jgi:hypothetical protein
MPLLDFDGISHHPAECFFQLLRLIVIMTSLFFFLKHAHFFEK